MNVVHLLSNWKWTERAEPAALLARAQQAAGIHIEFICGSGPPDATDAVAMHARAFGLSVMALPLSKHTRPLETWRAVRMVRRHLEAVRPDVVHCHMPNAHLVAALAVRSLDPVPQLVRSCYDPEARELGLRERLMQRPLTHGAIVVGEPGRQRLIKRLGFSPDRVAVIEPGIDLERFDPARFDRDAARRRWAIPPDAPVIGMVTRIRRTRRTDMGIRLLHAVREQLPDARLLLVGRGAPDEVRRAVTGPATRLGVADRVILAGYQAGDDLVTAYRAMNVLLYPVPGTDQSCRTVREAMAAGLPVIAGATGFLPFLVADGVTGRLSDLSLDGLAGMVTELARDREMLHRMAGASRRTAETRFNLSDQAAQCVAFYHTLAGLNRSAG